MRPRAEQGSPAHGVWNVVVHRIDYLVGGARSGRHGLTHLVQSRLAMVKVGIEDVHRILKRGTVPWQDRPRSAALSVFPENTQGRQVVTEVAIGPGNDRGAAAEHGVASEDRRIAG